MATIYDFKALSNRGKEVNVVSRRYAPVVEPKDFEQDIEAML